MIDGRNAGRRNAFRSMSTGSSTGTPTPTHASAPINPLSDPLLSHSSLDGSDPLTQFAREELDPLSKMAADEARYNLKYCDIFERAVFTDFYIVHVCHLCYSGTILMLHLLVKE